MTTLKTRLMLFATVIFFVAANFGLADNPAVVDDRPPVKDKQSTPLALSDLNLQHDGKDVTVMFKVTDTQLIGGTRERQFPHIILHHNRMKERPSVTVRVHGDLADAFHRFALVSPDDQFVGRTIKGTGKLTIYKDFPEGVDQTPVYMLILRDVDRFQIVREGHNKAVNRSTHSRGN